jgi:hypothetical protein
MSHHLSRWIKHLPRQRANIASARRHCARPNLELLEDRLAPAVFNVNTLADLSIAGGVNPDGTIVGQGNTVTLRSAIQAANSNSGAGGNTINLTLRGTYQITQLGTPGETDNLAGEFSIFPTTPNGNLSIINSSGGTAIVDGGGNNRVFDINASANTTTPIFLVTMQGFTIQHGAASPGDGAAGSGGGIREQGTQSLTLTNMVVTSNTATADGGGLVMFDPVNPTPSWVLTINASTISNNHAGDAGGGIDTDGTGTVFINAGTVITGNTDLNQGAGVYIDVAAGNPSPLGADMTMTGTIVSNNSALASGITASGGGISNAGTGTMTITDSTIENNFSGGQGGGFSDENNNGTLIVSNSIFRGNTATMDGGGIQEGGPSTTITNTEFDNNSSGATGGALFANGPTLTVSSSTFSGNTSITGGGAIEVQTTGTAIAASAITNSTITGNSALSNASTATGGGIDAPASFTGTLALLQDTINGNFADTGGGISWAGTANSAVSVQNTIIAGNSASTAGPDANNAAGTFTDNGGNLIGISGAGSGNTGFTALTTQTGTVASPLDALLAVLGNNGGPTIGAPSTTQTLLTEALLLGSPALDRGVAIGAPAVDERGFPRPDAGTGESPDVGAFEFQDVALSVSISGASPVDLGSTENLTVTVSNTSGNALPADNSTVTVTLPSGLSLAGTPLTFVIGAVAAHGSKSFTVTTTATALGPQTITAMTTSPDANPAQATTNTTITVQPAAITPVGNLTVFAFGFSLGFSLDFFEVDSQGNVFTQAFSFFGPMGTPVFINSMVQVALTTQNGMLLALLDGMNSQVFLIDILNFLNPFVFPAVLTAPRI